MQATRYKDEKESGEVFCLEGAAIQNLLYLYIEERRREEVTTQAFKMWSREGWNDFLEG